MIRIITKKKRLEIVRLCLSCSMALDNQASDVGVLGDPVYERFRKQFDDTFSTICEYCGCQKELDEVSQALLMLTK